MFIPILLGTARKGRRSEAVAKKLVELVESFGHETELVDVRSAGLSATDDTGTTESAKYWKSIVERCKGFIIVTPEYNHGYPGELKIYLDQLFKEYANKVVGIVSVSNGLWGGTRVTEQLRPVLNAYGLIVLGIAIHLRNVGSMIDEKGEYHNEEFPEFAKQLVSQLVDLSSKINR